MAGKENARRRERGGGSRKCRGEGRYGGKWGSEIGKKGERRREDLRQREREGKKDDPGKRRNEETKSKKK